MSQRIKAVPARDRVAAQPSATTPKVMKQLDAGSGKMVCRVCGKIHFANIARGGKYKRGSWQCVNGCKLPGSGRRA